MYNEQRKSEKKRANAYPKKSKTSKLNQDTDEKLQIICTPEAIKLRYLN